jgi:hypothetical protein
MQPSPEYTGKREEREREREREREKTWMEKRVSMATGGGSISGVALPRRIFSSFFSLYYFIYFYFFVPFGQRG